MIIGPLSHSPNQQMLLIQNTIRTGLQKFLAKFTTYFVEKCQIVLLWKEIKINRIFCIRGTDF